MTIKEKNFQFIPALFLILLVTGTAVLLFLSNLLPHANNRFEAGPATTFDTHWTITEEGLTSSDINLPTSLPDTRATLTNTLPDTLPEDAVLGIPTAFQSLTVFIDGIRFTAFRLTVPLAVLFTRFPFPVAPRVKRSPWPLSHSIPHLISLWAISAWAAAPLCCLASLIMTLEACSCR